MDRESLNEYGHIVLTAIVASLILILLTGSLFTVGMKNVVTKIAPEHEQYSYVNNTAYAEYVARPAPSITITPIEIVKGETIDLTSFITATNADGVDITNQISFYINDEKIDTAFVGSSAGTYTVKARVVDKTDTEYYGKFSEIFFDITVTAS